MSRSYIEFEMNLEDGREVIVEGSGYHATEDSSFWFEDLEYKVIDYSGCLIAKNELDEEDIEYIENFMNEHLEPHEPEPYPVSDFYDRFD